MNHRQAIEDYLRLRRGLGFALRGHDRLLFDFLDHLDQHDTPTITIEAALAWATKPTTVQPIRWKARLSVVRGFARYLHNLDPRVQVPPTNLLPHRACRPTPYVFSAAEIEALLAGAAGLASPIRAVTHHALFGLLVASGLRIGEAIGLNDSDIDFDTGLLTVADSKFHKGRMVPLHPTVLAELKQYTQDRDRLSPNRPSNSFFVSAAGTRLIYVGVRQTFRRIAAAAGIGASGPIPPRIHGLRHTFTVNCLIDWYREGLDVAAMMPLLSAYLGHVSPESTYWYQQATPELLSRAADLLESAGQPQP